MKVVTTREGLAIEVDQRTGRGTLVRDASGRAPAVHAEGVRYDSKLELAFHHLLLARQHVGEFMTVMVHALTFTLAKDCRFTPDFPCITREAAWVIFEVKGYMREDARVKLQVAARLYPWARWVLVTREKGTWIETPVGA